MKVLGFSSLRSECIGEMVGCAIYNCGWKCYTTSETECRKCVTNHCGSAFVKCSGFDENTYRGIGKNYIVTLLMLGLSWFAGQVKTYIQ